MLFNFFILVSLLPDPARLCGRPLVAIAHKQIKAEIIREIDPSELSGRNDGIFEVQPLMGPSHKLLLEIPTESINLGALDQQLTAMQSFEWAPHYYGMARTRLRGRERQGPLFDFVEGKSIFDPQVLARVNDKTIQQVFIAISDLLKMGLFPGDSFQYFVRADGSIAIIDSDHYLSLDSDENKLEAKYWLKSSRIISYLFAEEVRGKKLPKTFRKIALQYIR